MKINTSTLVKDIAKETNLKEKEIKLVLDAILEYIKDRAAEGNDVQLLGFGKFYPKKIKRKEVKMNGETYKIKAKYTLKFSSSKSLKL